MTGPLAPKVVAACGGRLCRRVVKGKVLRMDRPGGWRVLRFDGLSGRGLWYRPSGADYKKGARLRRGLCRRVVSPQGKRLTMICASLALLQIMFAVHRFAQGATAPAALRVADCPSRAMLIKSALRDLLPVSYSMISILRIGSLRSPPPIRLRRTSPYSGGRIKL